MRTRTYTTTGCLTPETRGARPDVPPAGRPGREPATGGWLMFLSQQCRALCALALALFSRGAGSRRPVDLTAPSWVVTPARRLRRTGRQHRLAASAGALVAAAGVVIAGMGGVAFANAANPLPDSQGSAVMSGTVTHNLDGTFTVASGKVAVTVSGTWDWGLLSGSTVQQNCSSRYGVGWAVDWAGLTASQTAAVGTMKSTGSWPIAKITPAQY